MKLWASFIIELSNLPTAFAIIVLFTYFQGKVHQLHSKSFTDKSPCTMHSMTHHCIRHDLLFEFSWIVFMNYDSQLLLHIMCTNRANDVNNNLFDSVLMPHYIWSLLTTMLLCVFIAFISIVSMWTVNLMTLFAYFYVIETCF